MKKTSEVRRPWGKRVAFGSAHFACAVLALSLVSAAQAPSDQELAEGRRYERFFGLASSMVEEVRWAYPERPEGVLTYREDTVVNLRVQFPLLLDGDGDCRVTVWSVSPGAPTVYDQLYGVYESSRGVSLEDMAFRDFVGMLAVSTKERRIPCESPLALLLGRATEFSRGINEATAPAARFYTDTPTHSFAVRVGDLRMTVDFPATVPHPIAEWARDVRRTVGTLLADGFLVR